LVCPETSGLNFCPARAGLNRPQGAQRS
jgi:hypothetical protein